MLDPAVTVTAVDETLAAVLGSRKGPDSVKALGWMMFGGLEDGAEIVPEPLLDEHIICNAKDKYVLITFNFAVKALERENEWTLSDTRGFDALGKVLADLRGSLQAEPTAEAKALKEAVARGNLVENEKPGTSKLHRRTGLKRKPTKRKKSFTKSKELTSFVKAARYVRGPGAARIHPSAKLRLFGLMMQAKKGDAPHKRDEEVQGGGDESTDERQAEITAAETLLRLKRKAWEAERGKDRKVAMNEHVAFLTSLAPQWRVSTILRAHESLKQSRPRHMRWTLKVEFEKRSMEKVLSFSNELRSSRGSGRAPSLALSSSSSSLTSRLCAKRISVLQGSDGDGNALLWIDEQGVGKGERASPAEGSASRRKKDALAQVDPFVAGMPTDLSLGDCIVDKIAHKSLEAQRAFFEKNMRHMAREGHDKDDGWTFYGKTSAKGVAAANQLKIHSRQVSTRPDILYSTRTVKAGRN